MVFVPSPCRVAYSADDIKNAIKEVYQEIKKEEEEKRKREALDKKMKDLSESD